MTTVEPRTFDGKLANSIDALTKVDTEDLDVMVAPFVNDKMQGVLTKLHQAHVDRFNKKQEMDKKK